VNTDNTKAMQEALEAAVTKLNSSNGSNGRRAEPELSGPTDVVSLVASLLPKLLGRGDDREELADKLEELQANDLKPLREHVLLLRKQVHRLARVQEQMLAQLRDIGRLQAIGNDTVLLLAQQMQRLEIVDEPPAPPAGGRKASPAPGGRERAGGGNEQPRSRRPARE
jgi:hypothetical protein